MKKKRKDGVNDDSLRLNHHCDAHMLIHRYTPFPADFNDKNVPKIDFANIHFDLLNISKEKKYRKSKKYSHPSNIFSQDIDSPKIKSIGRFFPEDNSSPRDDLIKKLMMEENQSPIKFLKRKTAILRLGSPPPPPQKLPLPSPKSSPKGLILSSTSIKRRLFKNNARTVIDTCSPSTDNWTNNTLASLQVSHREQPSIGLMKSTQAMHHLTPPPKKCPVVIVSLSSTHPHTLIDVKPKQAESLKPKIPFFPQRQQQIAKQGRILREQLFSPPGLSLSPVSGPVPPVAISLPPPPRDRPARIKPSLPPLPSLPHKESVQEYSLTILPWSHPSLPDDLDYPHD